jgi:SpoU rRNA methylase family enzyme
MIGRALALAALVGSPGIDVVPLTHGKPVAVAHELLQQASIITPEGVMVDPNNKEELKKYDNRHDLSELADTLRKEFGVTTSHLTQLIACTGTVVCRVPSADGKRIDIYRAAAI